MRCLFYRHENSFGNVSEGSADLRLVLKNRNEHDVTELLGTS
jgi:hypothetical protein